MDLKNCSKINKLCTITLELATEKFLEFLKGGFPSQFSLFNAVILHIFIRSLFSSTFTEAGLNCYYQSSRGQKKMGHFL